MEEARAEQQAESEAAAPLVVCTSGGPQRDEAEAPAVPAPAALQKPPPSQDEGEWREECESLRERCGALEERNARLLDEIAILRGRVEVDIPHWAYKARGCADTMLEIIQPMLTVPFGVRLQHLAQNLFEVEAGLRGLGGAPLREELAELRVQFQRQLSEATRRDAEMQDENDRLRMMLQAVGVSVAGGGSHASPGGSSPKGGAATRCGGSGSSGSSPKGAAAEGGAAARVVSGGSSSSSCPKGAVAEAEANSAQHREQQQERDRVALLTAQERERLLEDEDLAKRLAEEEQAQLRWQREAELQGQIAAEEVARSELQALPAGESSPKATSPKWDGRGLGLDLPDEDII